MRADQSRILAKVGPVELALEDIGGAGGRVIVLAFAPSLVAFTERSIFRLFGEFGYEQIEIRFGTDRLATDENGSSACALNQCKEQVA